MTRSSVANEWIARLLARAQLRAGHFPGEVYFVRAAFRALLDREPDAAATAHYSRLLADGRAARADVLNDIVASPEYRARMAPRLAAARVPRWIDRALWLRIAREEARLARAAGGLSPDEAFLHAAYAVLLRRTPDGIGMGTLGANMRSGALTRADVFWTLRRSPEFLQRQGLRLHPAIQAKLFAGVARRYLRAVRGRALPLDGEAFLRAAYSGLLDREVDEAGAKMFLDPLRRGRLSPLAVLVSICDSPEFKRRAGLPISPLEAVHQARMILFQTRLPPAEAIVDLGGAAHNEPRGALLMMGYPHRARAITILDLPPDDRIGGAAAAERGQELMTDEGTAVRYLYRSMADLAPIPDGSVDLVVSGESIEHISEAEADAVCDHAFRILRPGGSFCLDTPNAALTRLESPDALIHPEHQKEYYPAEIRAKLERRGFAIVDAAAICPMPVSLTSGRFDYGEMTRTVPLGDDPDEGYMFFFRAQKP